MKKYLYILLLLAFTTSCVTPSRLGVNYKGQRIYTSSSKTIDNPNIGLNVNSLTKEDVGYDVKLLRNRFISCIYKNEMLSNLIQIYPDLKIEIEISPSEKIKRTWIFDAAFFWPFTGWFPYTPWWGTTDLTAKLSINIPNTAIGDYKFNSSERFSITHYPYYKAGRILSETYSAAYNSLFEQISEFNFEELVKKTNSTSMVATSNNSGKYTFKFKSDVDNDIPELEHKNQFRFALIIGNEDYASQQTDLTNEVNVDFARNDASAFKEYAIKSLNIPVENVTFILDATTGKMKQALDRISLLAKNSSGNAELFFFYAGHGLPDEVNKEPFLIPVDVSGNNVSEGIKLMDAYKKLTEYPCKRVTVFLDACFSGGARKQGLIASRGVKVKPKEEVLNGNIVVFTASSGEQSSLAYKDKEHGLFTYYLLKKIKESKGNFTYQELSDYLMEQIGLKSVLINNKEQNPQTNVSSDIQNKWQNWKFN